MKRERKETIPRFPKTSFEFSGECFFPPLNFGFERRDFVFFSRNIFVSYLLRVSGFERNTTEVISN